jgi:hypothetical protein
MKKLIILLALFCASSFAQVVNPGGCTTCVQKAGDTMTGNLIFTGGTGITTPTGTNIYNDGNSTIIDFYNQAYTANNRRMIFGLSAGSLTGTFVNDDFSAASSWLLVQGNSAGVTSVGFTGPTSVTGTLTATVGTMPVVSITGTAINVPHTVFGTATLVAGTATIALTGSAIYTSSSSYSCSVNDASGTAVTTSSQNTASNSFKIFGTGTDSVSFVCVGN